MVEKPRRADLWGSRLVVYAGGLVGIGLIVAAAISDDPPAWWWFAGVPLALLFGTLASYWVVFRIRHPTREARARHLEELEARRAAAATPMDRSRLAHRATKHKKEVLRQGTDAIAVVTFLADGKRELAVKVDPGDPQRVRRRVEPTCDIPRGAIALAETALPYTATRL